MIRWPTIGVTVWKGSVVSGVRRTSTSAPPTPVRMGPHVTTTSTRTHAPVPAASAESTVRLTTMTVHPGRCLRYTKSKKQVYVYEGGTHFYTLSVICKV